MSSILENFNKMKTEIYCGKIENLCEEHPYSPSGFLRVMSDFNKTYPDSEIDKEMSFVEGRINYLNKKRTKGFEVFYSFKGKKDSEGFTGSVRFVLDSEDVETMSKIKESIKKDKRMRI